MKIEIRSFKHFPSMSEETNCFKAVLWIDGAKFCPISDRGQGYEIELSANWEDIEPINDWCKANLPKWGSEYGGKDDMDSTLQKYLSELVEEKICEKDFKKLWKSKIILIDPKKTGCYSTIKKPLFNPAKHEGSGALDWFAKEYEAFLHELEIEYPKETVLNLMPEDKALAFWLEHHRY